MPCCALLLLCFLGPRVVIALTVFFSDYIGRAYETDLWPFIGWLFLPWTTLAYAFAINSNGEVSGLYALLMVVAALVDLGVIGGGASKRKSGKS